MVFLCVFSSCLVSLTVEEKSIRHLNAPKQKFPDIPYLKDTWIVALIYLFPKWRKRGVWDFCKVQSNREMQEKLQEEGRKVPKCILRRGLWLLCPERNRWVSIIPISVYNVKRNQRKKQTNKRKVSSSSNINFWKYSLESSIYLVCLL